MKDRGTNKPPEVDNAMLKIALLVVYFTHLLLSGNFHAKGGGSADPLGHSAPPPPSPDTVDSGGGNNPWG